MYCDHAANTLHFMLNLDCTAPQQHVVLEQACICKGPADIGHCGKLRLCRATEGLCVHMTPDCCIALDVAARTHAVSCSDSVVDIEQVCYSWWCLSALCILDRLH